MSVQNIFNILYCTFIHIYNFSFIRSFSAISFVLVLFIIHFLLFRLLFYCHFIHAHFIFVDISLRLQQCSLKAEDSAVKENCIFLLLRHWHYENGLLCTSIINCLLFAVLAIAAFYACTGWSARAPVLKNSIRCN